MLNANIETQPTRTLTAYVELPHSLSIRHVVRLCFQCTRTYSPPHSLALKCGVAFAIAIAIAITVVFVFVFVFADAFKVISCNKKLFNLLNFHAHYFGLN